MIRGAVLLGFAILLAGCPVTQPTDTPVPEKRLIEPQTGSKYYLYVPSYYTPERDWPLVVTLHGTPYWDTYDKQIHEWQDTGERKGLIVVAPKLRGVQGILPVIRHLFYRDLARDERTIMAVIDEVSINYRVDPKAILLTGFSAGGYPLYYVGLRNPERFSMLIARACNSDLKMFERIRITDAARKLPIRIFWGKDDLRRLQRQSWNAFRWLRMREFYNTRKKELHGGHLRRPDIAYEMWRPYLPKRHRRKPQ